MSNPSVVSPENNEQILDNSTINKENPISSDILNDDANNRPRRAIKLNEKGKQLKLNTLKTFMKTLEKRLDKQTTLIETLLTSSSMDVVNTESSNLDRQYTEFSDAHARYILLVEEDYVDADDNDEDATAQAIWMETVDSKYYTFKEKVLAWIIEKEKKSVDRRSVRSHRSEGSRLSRVSSKHSASSAGSRHSKASSVDSKRSVLSLQQKAKIAGLKAEAEGIRETKEAELRASLLKVEQEIKKAEAMEKVYSSPENELDARKKSAVAENKKYCDHDAVAYGNKLPTSSTSLGNAELQIAMMEMMKLQNAPKPDLDIFSGDPLEFTYFKATFKEVVENVVMDQRGRLMRLIKYTSGEAKDLIKHLVHANSENCYVEAMSLLEKEYGNPHLISCSYLKRLRQAPVIKLNDSVGFKKYYRFLLKCRTYKRQGRLQELDSIDMIRTIVSKTDYKIQERWSRKAINIRGKYKKEADFSDLVKFMEMEAAFLNDPAYSRNAFFEANSVKTYATGVVDERASNFTCPLCSRRHDLEDCIEYLEKGVDQRHKFVFQCKLCFSCLQPTSEMHVAKNCTVKRKCKVCNAEHPTTLHGSNRSNINHSKLDGSVISMCVVPVEVWHKDHKDKKMTVYALLDDCSQATFIKEDILESLNVPQKRYTSINIKTLNGEQENATVAVDGLVVQCVQNHSKSYPNVVIELPCTYSQCSLAIDEEEIPTPEKISRWDHLKSLAAKIPAYNESIPIGLMIGANCPAALEPVEVIPAINGGPYAKRSRLGWCVIGPIDRESSVKSINCCLTRTVIPVKDVITGDVANHYFAAQNSIQDMSIANFLQEMYATEFSESTSEKRAMSIEDEKFLEIMKGGVCKRGSQYELPLPFRDEKVQLPNNRGQAVSRLTSMKRKFRKNDELHAEYIACMDSLISKGYAKVVDTSIHKEGKVWYIPHHGVYHKVKGKLRVVFDCSVKYKGRSLNDELIQGPDLTNLLVGVLLRFRKENIAFMADIEAMFHQVLVPEEQSSFFRFLWWPYGQLDSEPQEYEMQAHIFGAVSSPSCANFALKQAADDGRAEFGDAAADTLIKNFYVDDLLKSTGSVDEAIHLIESVHWMCKAGGFNLHKFVSNSRDIINSLPPDSRASSVVNLDITKTLPVERALGVHWCVESDVFSFRIVLQDRPLTRRGILGTISTIYDPLGLASPFVFKGRKILQAITIENSSWDDDVSPELRSLWEIWREDMLQLQTLKISRCYKPDGFKVSTSSLHSFSDASDQGYGQVTYLRQVSEEGDVCVSLVMSKSRVAPAKATTVPRMELSAALVSTKVTSMLKEELQINNITETYWVDSMVVLGYIQNDIKRFRTFVANRVKKIRDQTMTKQWKYIRTDQNPADYASRGLSFKDTGKVTRWFHGPPFLKDKELSQDAEVNTDVIIGPDDPEVLTCIKSNSSKCTESSDGHSILDLLGSRISNWMRQKRVIATVMKFIKSCKNKSIDKDHFLTTMDIEEAGKLIIKMVQNKHFYKDITVLKAGRTLKSSNILPLDPYLDNEDILRVGGRLRKSFLDENLKHPIILPKKEVIVKRMIEWHHNDIEHLGRTSTLSEMRSQGFWLISGNSQVRGVTFKCVRCRWLRGKLGTQKMSDLPESRITTEAPFSYCGLDMFGPFLVKEGRKEVKRYGIIFTCLSCRAIHLETTNNMDTDSFILSLRRFIARRGPVRYLRSDNGGNFVGADKEMRKAFKEMDHKRIHNFLLNNSCDWVQWERNPPYSSHMGGVWERLIRSVRNVLKSILKTHAGRLNDESLRTLMTEVEAIVNSRPLTIENLSDETVQPLTPNSLLTMKSKVVLPPPGVFQKEDVYCRRRWRAVQYLANVFWEKWRKEYIITLQNRQKWKMKERNFELDDVVLIMEPNVTRNEWPLGRIIGVNKSDDGLVRSVSLKVAASNEPLVRPVTKLVLLLGKEMQKEES